MKYTDSLRKFIPKLSLRSVISAAMTGCIARGATGKAQANKAESARQQVQGVSTGALPVSANAAH